MAYIVISGVAAEVNAEEVDDLLSKIEKGHGRHPVAVKLQDGAGLIVVNNESSYVVLDVLPAGVVNAGVIDEAVLERDDPELFNEFVDIDPALPLWLVVNGLAFKVDPEDVDDLLSDLRECFGNRLVNFCASHVDYFVIAPESAYAVLHHLPAGTVVVNRSA